MSFIVYLSRSPGNIHLATLIFQTKFTSVTHEQARTWTSTWARTRRRPIFSASPCPGWRPVSTSTPSLWPSLSSFSISASQTPSAPASSVHILWSAVWIPRLYSPSALLPPGPAHSLPLGVHATSPAPPGAPCTCDQAGDNESQTKRNRCFENTSSRIEEL